MKFRNWRTAILWVVIVVAASCAKNPVAPRDPQAIGAEDSVFTDRQVRAAANSTYSAPVGFYFETRPATYRPPLYASTLSVAPRDSFPNRWVELSTDDLGQARIWATATLARAEPLFVVDSGEPTLTSRYIEFVTYQTGKAPRLPIRVHRASYLDRSGFDHFHPGSSTGVLMLRPIDASAVRGVAEYLWYLDHLYSWPGPDMRVLSSFTRASEGSILQTIFFVERKVTFGFFGPVTWLELDRVDYRVDSTSGAVTLRWVHVRDVST